LVEKRLKIAFAPSWWNVRLCDRSYAFIAVHATDRKILCILSVTDLQLRLCSERMREKVLLGLFLFSYAFRAALKMG
jgi:hypothetical protein